LHALHIFFHDIDELVKELRTSDVAISKAAIQKADTYLQSLKQHKGFDKTVVNASSVDDMVYVYV